MSLLIVVIALALIFDYINGFHDAANSIATIVSTKVLTPFQAVLWAAMFNFVAFFIFKDHNVANTISKTVKHDFITLPVVLAGLLAAIFWNLLTWWFGIPSSSSHTLIGGFGGAALAHAGLNFTHIKDVLEMEYVLKIFLFIFAAPFIGMIVSAYITFIALMRNLYLKLVLIAASIAAVNYVVDFNKYISIGLIVLGCIFGLFYIWNELKPPSAARTSNMYKKLQLVSSAAFSIGHGGNDAQKVMGIISAALVANGNISDIKHLPYWVPLACYTSIALGTMSGGWKIVKTMGTRITKVTPLEGVTAETAGALTLFMTEKLKIPVSTTHTITGSIIGTGITKRISAVRWGVTVNLLWAWILTIPVSAILAALIFYVVNLFL